MIIGLIIALLVGAAVLQFIKKYVLQIPDPSIDDVWSEMEQQSWYQEWVKNKQVKIYLENSKRSGLLSDPYYVKKVIHHPGTRAGFIEFMEKDLSKAHRPTDEH